MRSDRGDFPLNGFTHQEGVFVGSSDTDFFNPSD